MPRVATNSKQKNKRFKGSSKGTKKAHTKATKTKGINKIKNTIKPSKAQRLKARRQRLNKQAQKLANANQYLDNQTKLTVTQKLKSQNQNRIVLFVSCNGKADINSIMLNIANYVKKQDNLIIKTQLSACKAFPAYQIASNTHKSPIKNGLFMIGSIRQPRQLLDLAKCADIICPLVSVLSADAQRITQDPYNYGGAFDQSGYTTINLLRSLGLPRIVGIIQHGQQLQQKSRQKITKYYRRFLSSQFGNEKILNIENQNDISSMIRMLDSCGLVNQSWKTQRGYILADQYEIINQSQMTISGYLKGSCINPNQIVHLTGMDDYHIEKIQIISTSTKIKNNMENQIIQQFRTTSDQIYPFSKPQTQDPDGDILTALNGLQIQQHFDEQMQQDKNQQQQYQDDLQDQDDSFHGNQQKAEQKAKRVQMQMRKQDELQFQDQVQYAAEQTLRDKFRQYQGLKSFKASQWNTLENLPKQYDRIFIFKNINQTHQAALKDNLARGFAYPGFYVRITITGIKTFNIQQYIRQLPIIVSFLLKNQKKMTIIHGKVQKNAYYEGQQPAISGQPVIISVGFRRTLETPIYSRCINGTDKTKYTKAVKEDYQNYYYCSYYGLNQFNPSPFLVFRVSLFNTNQMEGAPLMKGQLIKSDPMHVILQRIILTGYPYKINRRRSTVRYMFFNPQDVKYFKPIQVKTKMGLRGKIEQSLGTHGLMKVMFNDPIKHNDTVCMHLYRRVYPIWTY